MAVTPASAGGATDRPADGLPGFLDELRWRGLFHDATPGLAARLATGRQIAAYNGFDPSGASLHVGHLVPITALVHLQQRGGRPVVLVGGGTGMIGDPSGTSAERNLLDHATLEANLAGIRSQLERFLSFEGPNAAVMVNNLDWLSEISMIEFLRDVGKHFTIPYMLAKDSVQTRLGGGLSFTEFSYMLLQAADFRHLYRTLGVELQMGGADQWGNITAGLELIRRTEEPPAGSSGEELAHALAFTLLLDPGGAKFGKTAAGTSVWLDAERTTPYAFYQYWLGQADADVGQLLRFFTLLDRPSIEALEAEQASRPEERPAQRALALEVTARVHGRDTALEAERRSREVFSGGLLALDEAAFRAAIAELPRTTIDGSIVTAAATAVAAGAVSSNGEARRLIAQGGLYVNDRRVTSVDEALPAPVHDRYWVLRTGKKNVRIVERAG
ncbi:MAG TPA: tyrosine--tRNA ligase [Candidatus Limnocylindrales bacterium]|nr:tyrosine--tRNA ligase [Candidatus Limnocylindrales bacterium]